MRNLVYDVENRKLKVTSGAEVFFASSIKPYVRGALEPIMNRYVYIDDGVLYVLETTNRPGEGFRTTGDVKTVVAIDTVVIYT